MTTKQHVRYQKVLLNWTRMYIGL